MILAYKKELNRGSCSNQPAALVAARYLNTVLCKNKQNMFDKFHMDVFTGQQQNIVWNNNLCYNRDNCRLLTAKPSVKGFLLEGKQNALNAKHFGMPTSNFVQTHGKHYSNTCCTVQTCICHPKTEFFILTNSSMKIRSMSK